MVCKPNLVFSLSLSQAEQNQIKTSLYLNSLSEFDDLLAEYTALEMELNGCKKRTARGK